MSGRNLRLKDGSIQLTHCDGHETALLTVRGKDHDLDAGELRELAQACEAAADGMAGDCKTCEGSPRRTFSSKDRYAMVDWLNRYDAAGWRTSSTSMSDGTALCWRCTKDGES